MVRRPIASLSTTLEKAAAFKAELDRIYPDDLHKELWAVPKKAPNGSLYEWWWSFMKANEQNPGNTAITAVGDAAKKTIGTFGTLKGSFVEWWDAGGVDLFREQKVPKIIVHDAHADNEDGNQMLTISLPLGISKGLIRKQIDLLLDAFHENNDFKRHKASTAKLRIHPKIRYREIDYGKLINTWEVRQESLRNKVEKPFWEIHCEVNNLKAKIAAIKDDMEGSEADRIDFGKAGQELFTVAEDMMQNALLGSFPNDTAARARKAAKNRA